MGKGTAQKATIKDTTSDSQVNSNFAVKTEKEWLLLDCISCKQYVSKRIFFSRRTRVMSNPVYIIYAKHICSVRIGYQNRMDKKTHLFIPWLHISLLTLWTETPPPPPPPLTDHFESCRNKPKTYICPDLFVRMRNPNRIGTKGLPSGNRTETALTLRNYALRRFFLVSASIFLTWLITLNAKMHVQI